MARSVAPSSSAPASDVTMPASNAATTSRPSTGSNPNKSGIHSVGIGALRDSARNSCGTTLFADSPPVARKAAETLALVAPAFDQQLNAMSLNIDAVRQSVDRIAASQEQITRTIDQIATSIMAGQQQTTRTTDQTATSVAQAPSANASAITVENRADGASSQPTARLDTKSAEARPPQALSEKGKQPSASGHDPSCFPSASAVLQNHPGGWPSWTMRAPGHEGTLCWYAAARPRASDHRPTATDHRRELMPREKEIVGTTENRLSAPPAPYTQAPE